jgi:hypothetical protein
MIQYLSQIKPSFNSFVKHVKNIDAFFEGGKFEGFVINIRSEDEVLGSNLKFDYEVFMSRKSSKDLIRLHEIIKSDNSNLTSVKDLILNSLIKIQISTDYDQKERKFTNYASLMNQKSNPTLLMEFDPLEKPIEFFIQWVDPDSKHFF